MAYIQDYKTFSFSLQCIEETVKIMINLILFTNISSLTSILSVENCLYSIHLLNTLDALVTF